MTLLIAACVQYLQYFFLLMCATNFFCELITVYILQPLITTAPYMQGDKTLLRWNLEEQLRLERDPARVFIRKFGSRLETRVSFFWRLWQRVGRPTPLFLLYSVCQTGGEERENKTKRTSPPPPFYMSLFYHASSWEIGFTFFFRQVRVARLQVCCNSCTPVLHGIPRQYDNSSSDARDIMQDTFHDTRNILLLLIVLVSQ